MINNLENFYYYLSEGDKGIVYEISYQQDKDKCGKHLVTYMTEPKQLTAGAYYYDLHGDKQKVEEDGTYQVKKEDASLDLEACKAVFPYFEVKYYKVLRDPRTGAYIKDEQGNYVKDTETLYTDVYWLQERIQDGDTVNDNGKFVMKKDHAVYPGSNTYIEDNIASTYHTIDALILSGADYERMQNVLPEFVFKGEWIKRYGTRIFIEDVTNSEGVDYPFGEDAIRERTIAVLTFTIYNEYKDLLLKYGIDFPCASSLIMYESTEKINVMDDYFNTPQKFNIFSNGNGVIGFEDVLEQINYEAFSDKNSLVSIIIPNSVTNLGESCFDSCINLVSVSLPCKLTKIKELCFNNCKSLKDIILPETLTEIDNEVFVGCSKLVEITIPESVVSIGNRCFEDCSSLKKVVFKSTTPPQFDDYYIFEGNADGRKIYVPSESLNAYKAALEDYSDDIVGY